MDVRAQGPFLPVVEKNNVNRLKQPVSHKKTPAVFLFTLKLF